MIYTATIEHVFADDTPVTGCGCGWKGTVGAVNYIHDCSLTPGDASPVGRCPDCYSLVYVDTPEARAGDEVDNMLAVLRKFAALPDAMVAYARAHGEDWKEIEAILSRIDGAPLTEERGPSAPPAPACAHCGEARECFAEDGAWTCTACNGMNEPQAETYAHSPDTCPSKHWNRGDDTCADCGADLA